MDSIVIDQTKIRVDEEITDKGGITFPRPLAWWQKTLPMWIDAAETEDGRIALTPNGKFPDGSSIELTPAVVRRNIGYIRNYLDQRRFLDFSDAIVNA